MTITMTITSPETQRPQDAVPDTDQVDGAAYLFGYPIAHSMSPLLHGTVYEGLVLNWRQYLLESKDIALFLRLIREQKCFGT